MNGNPTIDQSNLSIQEARKTLLPEYNCPEIALYAVDYFRWREGFDRLKQACLWLPRETRDQPRAISVAMPFDDLSVESVQQIRHKVDAEPLSRSTLLELGLKETTWSSGDKVEWSLSGYGHAEYWREKPPSFADIAQVIYQHGLKEGRDQIRDNFKRLMGNY